MDFDFIFSLLRKMFFNIDKIIYGLIDDVYGFVIKLASTSIFSTELINAFAERIYAFIGIFMLFKVTISLITHVLNPDDFTDKEKGFTSIIKRIILSLCMVVLVPYVFAEAYHFQKLILTENALVTLIFGTPPDTNGEMAQLAGTTYVDTAGKKMQFTLLSAFIHPNYEEFTIASDGDNVIDLSACRDLYVKDLDGNFKFRKKVGSDTKTSRYYYELNPACFGDYDSMNDKYLGEYTSENGKKEPGLYKAFGSKENVYQTYAQGVAQQNYDLMFRLDIIDLEAKGKYVMDYKWLVSTIVGVVTLYMLVMFCIDIAVRSVKLGFLQMIAPIPIISYVDPKSGKDGMFKKWTNMCVKTYLDLFIRLFALFFGIYIISLIGTFKDVMDGETISDGIVNVFLIIGVLIFVKKLPEILKETLGFEGGTFKDFKFNPIKRFEEDAIFGKNILAAGAAGLAGGAAFGANLVAKKGNIFSALAGGVSATSRGLVGAAKGEKFGKNFSNSYGGAIKARQNRAERRELGMTPLQYALNRAQHSIGMETRGEELGRVNQSYKDFSSEVKSAKSESESLVAKNTNNLKNNYGAYGNMSLLEARKKIADLERTGNSAAAAALEAAVEKNSSDWAKTLQKLALKGKLTGSYTGAGGASFAASTFDQNDQVTIEAHLKAAEQTLSTSAELQKMYRKTTGRIHKKGDEIDLTDFANVSKAANVEATRTSTEEKIQKQIDAQSKKN